jgi:hypothetical protein
MTEFKVRDFDIIKKNRKFFAATLNGYKCKIIIDEESKDLELGMQALKVEDHSVRSKFGTDLIYKVVGASSGSGEVVTLKHHTYNAELVKKCKNLGGKWCEDSKAWIFDQMVEQLVDDLDDLYNGDLVVCDVVFRYGAEEKGTPITLYGYPMAKASGRDSGAFVYDDVVLLQGGFDSGGSMKNWLTVVDDETTVRIKLSKSLLNREDLRESYIKEIKQL